MMRKSFWIPAITAIAACSCASAPRTAAIDMRPDTPVMGFQGKKAARLVNETDSLRGQSSDFEETPEAADEGVVVLKGKPKPNVQQASAGPHLRRTAAHFTPAERRGPVDCEAIGEACLPGAPCSPRSGFAPGTVCIPPWGPAVPPPVPYMATHAVAPPISLPRLYPDEYVCDGGDSGKPVHYDDYSRKGLEPEDTVAEYVDSDGEFRMKPSTKVCIYAPRFSAMRTLSGPNSDTAIHRLASAHETQYGAGMRNRDAINQHLQRQGVDGMRMRARLSGLEGERAGVGAQQTTITATHTKLINTFEDLAFVHSGQYLVGEEARLSSSIQAAIAWNRDQNPVIAAKTVQLQDVIAKFKPMEIVGREDRRTKGQLRIVKLADRKTAVPGDLVTFILRYDNLGDLPVSQVKIVDNLSPRLEFLDDTATSDRAGEVSTEDNGEGSVLVTIELDEPLPGKTGGIITFKTRVR